MSDPRETELALDPKFDAAGLITAVCTDVDTGEVLMVAHMNAEALAATRQSGEAVFWSRSRGRLWRKGETSGHVLTVREMRIDCDQDAVWLLCAPAGPACHTGRRSCWDGGTAQQKRHHTTPLDGRRSLTSSSSVPSQLIALSRAAASLTSVHKICCCPVSHRYVPMDVFYL